MRRLRIGQSITWQGRPGVVTDWGDGWVRCKIEGIQQTRKLDPAEVKQRRGGRPVKVVDESQYDPELARLAKDNGLTYEQAAESVR